MKGLKLHCSISLSRPIEIQLGNIIFVKVEPARIITKALSFYSVELFYKASQMFCFETQCLKNKTNEGSTEQKGKA